MAVLSKVNNFKAVGGVVIVIVAFRSQGGPISETRLHLTD